MCLVKLYDKIIRQEKLSCELASFMFQIPVGITSCDVDAGKLKL